MEAAAKSTSFWQKALHFLQQPANFRLIFMIVLYCDIRYLSAPAYYSVIGVMAVWSLYLMIRVMAVRQRIMRVKFRRIIFIFLVFAFLSVVLHAEINLWSSLLTMHFLSVCLFLFYGIHAEKSNLRVKKEMKRLFDVLIVMTDLTMLIGLIVFAIFPSGLSLIGYHFGIMEGRFVGIIPNANVTAFYAVIAIVLCSMQLRIRRADHSIGKKRKVWYIASMVMNSFVLVLTDSNASMVLVMVYLSFLFFYELFKEFSLKKTPTFLLRIAASVLASVMVVTTCLFIRANVQKGMAYLLTPHQSEIVISKDLNASDDNLKLDKTELSQKPANKKKALGHQNTNIDSGRFVLWRQALGLIELYPLFGIGKDNIADYGVNYLGGIRYSNLGGYKYVDFHNGLLTITVSFGIVGLGLFLVFALTVAKAILKSIFKHKIRSRRDGNVLVLIAGFCAGYCVYSMFEAALFLDYTYRVYIFWLLVGFGLSYVMKYHQQGLHSKIDPQPLHDDTSEWAYLKMKFPFLFRKKKNVRPASSHEGGADTGEAPRPADKKTDSPPAS